MKNLCLLLLFLGGALLTSSCEKKWCNDITPVSLSRVKSTFSLRYSSTPDEMQRFFYNSDSTLRRYEMGNTLFTDYVYSGDTVLIYQDNDPKPFCLMFLNKDGLVDSSVRPQAYLYSCEVYEYDPHGYVTRMTRYDDGDIVLRQTYEISNGNTVSVTRTDYPSGETYTTYYQYDTDHFNSLNPVNFGQEYRGKFSKNPLTFSTVVTATGDSYVTEKRSYQFDSLGRISLGVYYLYNSGTYILADSAVYTFY